tara:strand:+ start:97 stop:309 length:213 start_codon:yes stop_codon:yes gene_type:complete
MEKITYEVKLEKSLKIILAIIAISLMINAASILQKMLISDAHADHDKSPQAVRGVASLHVTIDNWPAKLK